MVEATSPRPSRPGAAVVVLAGVVALSAVLRSVFAWRHSVPRLFPDEYIYAALSRSIGHGHLQIRGGTVHFPGLLEPILAAPIWRLFSLMTAYHLVQVENAVVVSLAAIPIYLLARSLRLSTLYSLAAAIYALLIPELVLVSYTSADAVSYPVALAAMVVAVTSLNQPTSKKQVAFVALASLATLGRAEYFALAPAYVIAAVVVDRRAAWRRHRIALAALVPAGALGALFAFGYYLGGPSSGPQHRHYASWFFLQLFLVAVELGVAIAPGVVAGLLGPRNRAELAFASFFGAISILVLVEATKPAAEKLEFKERYLFVLVALAPVAYGLYVRNARPLRSVVIGIAACIAVAAARLPLTEYTAATFKTDSQFLFAISESERRFGAGNSSLAIALLATAAALAAIVLAFRGNPAIPFFIAGAVALSASIVSTHVDVRLTRTVRAQLPLDLRWVDHAADGPVTAIETQQARKQDLLYQLYWNTSIDRERLLGSAIATDAFSAPRLQVRGNGVLDDVSGDVLFHDFAVTGWFANARRIAHVNQFTLWRSVGPARFQLEIDGRFSDGWLSPSARLRAWPHQSSDGVGVRFRLSLPEQWPKGTRMRFGQTTFAVRPGESMNLSCSSGRGPLDLEVSGDPTSITKDFRSLSVQLTRIAMSDLQPRASATHGCSVVA